MKPTLVVIGTCYSGVSLLASQQCLIAQAPISKAIYIVDQSDIRPLEIGLHNLVTDYYSVVLTSTHFEVKTHD